MEKRGFTLAEVLITLAIIGVVAALTIPAVVKNYKKTQTVTKLKKAYSVMNQAHRMAEVDNGPYETWDVEMSESSYYEKYLSPYFKAKSLCYHGGSNKYCSYKEGYWKNIDGTDTNTGICVGATFITTDNIIYAYRASTTDGEGNLIPYTYIYVDINGPQQPNRIGKDVFVFNRNKKGIIPNGVGYSIPSINNNCSSSSGYYCAAKIMADGWEIKDDYPW